MIHILLIDPIEKLTLNKDSSLQLGLAMKEQGVSVRLMFEENLYFSNYGSSTVDCYDFSGSFSDDGISPKQCLLGESENLQIDANIMIHMRLDPPFDSRYLRILWILAALKKRTGCQVTNNPDSIAISNEKMISYMDKESVESFVGSSRSGFMLFCEEMKRLGHHEIVIKPLDLYQGIGVEKLNLKDNPNTVFNDRVKKFGGAIVAQPYLKAVEEGEVRSIYYAGKHLGSILKKPKQGDFISNIAHGATYMDYQLNHQEEALCKREALRLSSEGLPWIAFDLLGGKIQEMNITCPGLLVEVSKANKKNLAFDLIDLLN